MPPSTPRSHPDDAPDVLREAILALVGEFNNMGRIVEAVILGVAGSLGSPAVGEDDDFPVEDWQAAEWPPVGLIYALKVVNKALDDANRGELAEIKLAALARTPPSPAALAWSLLYYARDGFEWDGRDTFAGLRSDPAVRLAVAESFARGGETYRALLNEWHAAAAPDSHDRLARAAAIVKLGPGEVIAKCGLDGEPFALVRRTLGEWAWAKRNREMWDAAGLDGIGRATAPPADDPPATASGLVAPTVLPPHPCEVAMLRVLATAGVPLGLKSIARGTEGMDGRKEGWALSTVEKHSPTAQGAAYMTEAQGGGFVITPAGRGVLPRVARQPNETPCNSLRV